MITRDDVLAAQQCIHGRVRRTPVVAVDPGSSNLWLKCEFLQLAGVFKTRGAFNRILTGLETGTLDPARGIVAASGGNAGLANAYAAAQVGVPATVFVPETAPAVKVARLRAYGATVKQVGREYAEAYAAAIDFSNLAGALFCHAYDQPEIAAGAGTIGEEILADIPDVDTIVVAVGGGGLFAGIAAAAEGRARVVAVEPVLIPTLHTALRAGQPVDIAVSGVAADSLGARRIGSIAFDVAQRTRPVSVLVDDEAITAARSALWRDYRMAVEHGAAAAYAGLTSGAPVTHLRVRSRVQSAPEDALPEGRGMSSAGRSWSKAGDNYTPTATTTTTTTSDSSGPAWRPMTAARTLLAVRSSTSVGSRHYGGATHLRVHSHPQNAPGDASEGGAYQTAAGERVAVVLCGANTDTTTLS